MEEEQKNYYRKIFVVEPSHDLRALKKYTDEIVLITTGYEDIENIYEKVEVSAKEFDPSTDAFVPIGKLITTFIAGMVLQKLVHVPIIVGIYKNKDYEFMEVGEINAP
jgi:hypothetical protein